MWFLRGRNTESEADKQRREESLKRLKAGGLPLTASERLEELAARQGTPQALFTTGLTLPEVMLVRQQGCAILGQVMGTVIYNVNASYSSGVSGELQLLSKANNESRQRALNRLKQEAVLLQATGVLDIRIETRQQEWDSEFHLTEVTAIGTAIRDTNLPLRRDSSPDPFLANISAADYWALRQAGYRPLRLAIGNCAYYRVGNPDIAYKANRWRSEDSSPLGYSFGINVERTDYTQGIYEARNIAQERMAEEARSARAEGIVGVQVDVETHAGASNGLTMDMFCHFVVVGTAIARQPGNRGSLDIQTNLPLK